VNASGTVGAFLITLDFLKNDLSYAMGGEEMEVGSLVGAVVVMAAARV
jgi:hypothetical protein